MTLPEIPEEAVEAVLRTVYVPGIDLSEEEELTREHLAAAWPHMYAAALRHVVPLVRAECPGDHSGDPCDLDPAVDLLHRLADEAVTE